MPDGILGSRNTFAEDPLPEKLLQALAIYVFRDGLELGGDGVAMLIFLKIGLQKFKEHVVAKF